MRTKQEIILQYFREGKSKRWISKKLGIHRKTVSRYVESYAAAKRRIEESGEEVEGLVEELVSAPKYDSSKRQKRKLTRELTGRIGEYLKQNQEKRSRGLHKQVMKKIDIWEALCEEGYDIGYTTVCQYIREQEAGRREAFIKQDYAPGEECEFDWAEVTLTIEGRTHRLMLAVFTAAMSNYRWASLFWRQDSLSFQQAHVDFFTAIQGVFRCMVYDNMRTVIRRFVGRLEKEPTESFLKLSTYYQFHWRFCNVGQPQEKGHVERSVEYVRRKAFAVQDCFESLQQANQYLQRICDGLNARPLQGKTQSAAELFQEEVAQLYVCPAPFDCGQILELKVDKYSTICQGTNHYSVPDHLVGKRVEVRLYPTYLLVYSGGLRQCRHERRPGRHQWYIDLDHYLDTLLRKPGALAGSMALKTTDKQLRDLFCRHFADRPKDFIQLLHYGRDKEVSVDSIVQAAKTCLRSCPHQPPSLDKIKILCTKAPAGDPAPGPVADNPIEVSSKKQLAAIAHLFSKHN